MWPSFTKFRIALRWWSAGVFRFPRNLGFASGQLISHFSDHAGDFSATTESEYEALADRFLNKPKTSQMHECSRLKGGDRVRFDKVTNEFGVVSPGGVIRSYYIPIPCASLPLGRPKIRCHKLPTNLDYVIATCK
jgi:hypothetical protein